MPGDVRISPSPDAIKKALGNLTPTDAELRRINRRFRAEMAKALKREAIPAMQEITPQRTGRAARSLRIKTVARPFGLEIGPGGKGFYLQFHPDAEEIGQRYEGIIGDVWNRHQGRILDNVITEVLQ